ncbi:MAG: YggS family pyridoxal phosphate-dependent enzyme [Legionellales bacterium]|nr:YggS family pyridoxal phosphate-dependent enzyme [Legionellales bacterium]
MNITKILQRVQDAEHAAHRHPGDVQILAVSKGQSAEELSKAFDAGLRHFGESYWQEASQKIQTLSNLPICWHFIGPLQSNKSRLIASHFSWVHSLSRSKIATLLNEGRPPSLPSLNVCLQVNLDDEITKSGITPESLTTLASDVLKCPRLNLRGLMVIPKPSSDEQQQYLSFLRATHLLAQLNLQLNLSLDTLSMGMSDDLEAAIRAGSTMVRIGRAIFGART